MKKIIWLILFIYSFTIPAYAQTTFDFNGNITKITDWDTIYVSTWWTNFKVRILWIDTPESYLFWWIKKYKFYWCWISASNYAKKNLKIWKNYNFYKDNLAKNIDKYWRKLRFLKIGTWILTDSKTYWYNILKQWLANFYKYENQTFSWVYKKIDDENKILWKWMYNIFCKTQDQYIKQNWKRNWWGEINTIIDETLKSKTNFHYQLQKANFNDLKNLTWTVIFLSPEDINLTTEQVNELKNNWNILIAYLSIWEAETYQNYWDSSWIDSNWKLTNKAPNWLWEKNPNWDSYKVKYWLTWWQNIIFNQIKNIKNKWYDWILLDTVDTYWYWSWYKWVSDADKKMINFIWKIRNYLWDYLAIIPNWWLPLVKKTWYLDLINGQLTESLFSYKNKERTQNDKDWQLQYLNKVKQAWKQVFDIDYIKDNNDLVCKYYDFIKGKEFLGDVYPLWLDSFQKIRCKKETNLKLATQWTWKLNTRNINKKIYHWWTTFKAPTCKNTQLICKQVWINFRLYEKDWVICQNWNLWKKCNDKDIEIVINNNLTKNSYYIKIWTLKILQIQNSKYNKLFKKIWKYIISKNFSLENKQKLINIINKIEKLLNIYSLNKTIKEKLINKVKLFSNTYNKILNTKTNNNIKKYSYNYYDNLIKNKNIQYQIKLKFYLKKLLYKYNFSKKKLIILKEKIENILNNKKITTKLKNNKLLIYINLRKIIIEKLTK